MSTISLFVRHLLKCVNFQGNQMFPALDNDLHFGYQLTGSLVVARSEEDEKFLEELIKRGDANGVKNLRILREEELKEVEPHIHPDSKVHDILLLSLLALQILTPEELQGGALLARCRHPHPLRIHHRSGRERCRQRRRGQDPQRGQRHSQGHRGLLKFSRTKALQISN